MRPLVIYHANCADGFGAAFAAWLKLGDDAEYVPCQYGEQADTWMERHNAEVTERDVYILDFSFNRQTMEDFFELAKRVVWLDHHKSALEMWEVQPGQRVWAETEGRHVKLHMDKSGAMLSWEYFHPGTEVPMFIKHIDDYDRWQFKIEGTKAFNKALWSQPFDFKAWKIIFLTPGYEMNAYHLMYREGNAILRAHDQNVQSVVKGSARKCNIFIPAGIRALDLEKDGGMETYRHNFIGLAANCPPHLHSDVGHQLATQSGAFGLCWCMNKDGSIKCGLRSNGEYDVSAIAKAFGGGGHRNSAGFAVDIQTLLGWLK